MVEVNGKSLRNAALRAWQAEQDALEALKTGKQRRKRSPPLKKRARVKLNRMRRKTSTRKRGRPPGVPDGMRVEEADALWATARDQAKRFIEIMEDEGLLDKSAVPGSDEGKAKVALEEMVAIVLSPLSHQGTKISAARTVLEWTKSKPVQKSEMALTNAEDWLKSVISDNKPSAPPSE